MLEKTNRQLDNEIKNRNETTELKENNSRPFAFLKISFAHMHLAHLPLMQTHLITLSQRQESQIFPTHIKAEIK